MNNNNEIDFSDEVSEHEQKYELVCVPEGTTVTLNCEARATEDITWFQNDQPISADTHFEIIYDGEKHHLIIHEAQLTDSALYSIFQAGERAPVAELIVEGKYT